jgi:NitT/TauT family transport system ATP-binding protein
MYYFRMASTETLDRTALSKNRGAAFSVRNVDFSYGQREVFRDLDLDVAPGEFVGVLGPSGCGKTTLLNLLAGFLQPQRGSITLAGTAVRPERRELGYVFQAPQLFPWLSVLRNVRFGLDMGKRGTRAERNERARAKLALVGLSDAADLLPHQLSGGMQQRAALARTLVLEPQLLLMDEPFAALDAITRGTMNDLTARLWRELGQTVLFITHDVEEAVFLADRIVVLGLVPQGIVATVAIDLPHPRDRIATRRDPRFMDYVVQLTEQIGSIVAAAGAVPSRH